jgi:predicted N-formylglutamate amidohydrolase
MTLHVQLDDVAETVCGGSNDDLVLTCDHASVRLPAPWCWPQPDLWIAGTHWSFDLGAAQVTRNLAAELRCSAILARFTRLLADANRCEGSEHIFRPDAEGQPIALNSPPDQRDERLNRYHRAYHRRVDHFVAGKDRAAMIGIHTFTPVYDGKVRALELGVLFNRHEERAHALVDSLRREGFNVGSNEPYSGYDGLMHGIECHATKYERPYVTVEIRQDLATDGWLRQQIVGALARAIPAHYV